jgi:peroxiredoxin
MSYVQVMTLQVGDIAPDVVVYDTDGSAVRTSELWRDAPVVVAFLRHFG